MATLKSRLRSLEQQLVSKQKPPTPEPTVPSNFAEIIAKIKADHAAGTLPNYTNEELKERAKQTIAGLGARFGY